MYSDPSLDVRHKKPRLRHQKLVINSGRVGPGGRLSIKHLRHSSRGEYDHMSDDALDIHKILDTNIHSFLVFFKM